MFRETPQFTIIGALSDRFGRKRALRGMLGAGLACLLLACAASILWLFAGYLISGTVGALYATANAYGADITSPEQRGRATG